MEREIGKRKKRNNNKLILSIILIFNIKRFIPSEWKFIDDLMSIKNAIVVVRYVSLGLNLELWIYRDYIGLDSVLWAIGFAFVVEAKGGNRWWSIEIVSLSCVVAAAMAT